MIIRPESERDCTAIRKLHSEAFRSDEEACLVDRLRRTGALAVSLVAEDEQQVIGHIALSPMQRRADQPVTLGLGPLAVVPERQNEGVGSALVEAAIEEARAEGVGALFVLGHPDYYPRFGFLPANHRGIQCVYEGPPEAFMVIELQPEGLRGYSGVVRYHEAFDM